MAKQSTLVFTKIRLKTGSFLDALAKIITHLSSREEQGQDVKGYTVISIPVAIDTDRLSLALMEGYIKILVEVFQAVIVVSAGNWPSKTQRSPIIFRYPALFSTKYPIITVGLVLLATNLEQNWKYLKGTSMSCNYVAGLALYLFSLFELGDQLRATRNAPAAARDYIVWKAYSRNNGPIAVWNGLDDLRHGENHGWII